MAEPGRVAIVAALEREVPVLVRTWTCEEREHEGRRFRFFVTNRTVLVCAGIGAGVARRACEAVIALYRPAVIISAGFAGALVDELKAGDTILPSFVVDAQDGSRIPTCVSKTIARDGEEGSGVLVSFPAIANREQKTKLAKTFGAQAVDMEAASVARAAQARGVPFLAVKAISDEANLSLPPLERFLGRSGEFETWRLLAYIAPRFWLWRGLGRLARNSRVASNNLCARLESEVLPQAIETHAYAERKS